MAILLTNIVTAHTLETASRLDNRLWTPCERDADPDLQFFECLSRLVIASPSSQTANWRSGSASLWPAFCHSLLSCRRRCRLVRWYQAIVNLILCGLSTSTENGFCLPMARKQIGLHFETFYVSWIFLQKKYYAKQGGQDLCQNPDFAANNYVEGHLLAEQLRTKRRGHAGTSWYVDETYVKVHGKWCYLYRAIDRDGNLVDSRRSRETGHGCRKAVLQPSYYSDWTCPRAGDNRWT